MRLCTSSYSTDYLSLTVAPPHLTPPSSRNAGCCIPTSTCLSVMMDSLAPPAHPMRLHPPDMVLSRIFAPSPILGDNGAHFVPFDHGMSKQDAVMHREPSVLQEKLHSDLSPLAQVSSGHDARPALKTGKWGKPLFRAARLREIKMSTVKPVHPLGKKHGSIRVKTQSVRVPDEAVTSDNDVPILPGSIPLRAETPLCTRIARSASRKSQRPRRKPAPQVDGFAWMHFPAASMHTRTCDSSTVPPPRPPKNPLRSLYHSTKGPEPFLPNQLAGLKLLSHSPPTVSESMQASDNDVPALVSDGDTDSLSSLDAP